MYKLMFYLLDPDTLMADSWSIIGTSL